MTDQQGNRIEALLIEIRDLLTELVIPARAERNTLMRVTEYSRRQFCRENGPHDAGYHVETCPDATGGDTFEKG